MWWLSTGALRGLLRHTTSGLADASDGAHVEDVYREIARNRKDDGTYQPWFAHDQDYM